MSARQSASKKSVSSKGSKSKKSQNKSSHAQSTKSLIKSKVDLFIENGGQMESQQSLMDNRQSFYDTGQMKQIIVENDSDQDEFMKLSSQQQKDVYDSELDDLERKLLKKLKKNEKYINCKHDNKHSSGLHNHFENNKTTMTISSGCSSSQAQSQRSVQQNNFFMPEINSKNLDKMEKRRLAFNMMESRLQEELDASNLKTRKERNEEMKSGISLIKEKKQRKWMIKHGKADLLQFSDEEVNKLRQTFNQLDEDGGGSIGIDELEELLIGLGLADSKEEIDQMILAVDDDGSGQIEFEEFLAIIQQSDATGDGGSGSKMNQFFKDMSNGEIGNSDLNFGINVQDIRRQLMMAAIFGSGEDQEGGQRILNNVRIQRYGSKGDIFELKD